MPVMNKVPKEGPAEQHHNPVAIQCSAFAGSGNIVKRAHTIAESTPDRFEAIPKNQPYFSETKRTDVLQILGIPTVHMVTLDAILRASVLSRPILTRITTKTIQHQLHHVALAMVRRR